jgi:hypothetical protein
MSCPFSVFLRALALIVLAGLLAGCGPSRWFPTDPRTAEVSTAKFAIDAHLEIGVGTTVTATAFGLQTATPACLK